MSKKRSDTPRGAEPPEIDDLKLINGIGPAVERRLHSVGIYTYAQLAALSPADIAAAVADLAGLSAERIIKQDWIGQARKLASESISSEAQEEIEAPPEPVVPSVVSELELAPSAPEKTEYVPPVVAEPELAPPAAEVIEPVPPVVAPPGAKEVQITPPVVAMSGSIGVPRLRQIETVPAGAHIPQNCLPYGQPFDVLLTLDLSDLRISADTRFSYRASIYSKSLEGHPRLVVGEASGIVTSTDKVTVSIAGTALPKGTYRLKAMVVLNQVTTEPAQQTGLVASKKGDLLLIF
jgi:Helix-hairpin-helix domain